MVIYLLLATVVLIFVLSMILFERDFIHPGVVISEVFIITILSALYNVKTWGMEIKTQTYFVIVSGILLFVAVSYLSTKIVKNLDKKEEIPEYSRLETINIPKFQQISVIIYCLLTGALYVSEVIRVSKSVGGGGDWSRIMYYYRQATSYGVIGDEGMSSIVGHMYDSMIAISYVYILIIVNNILVEGKKFEKKLLIPLVISCTTTILSAARIQLLYFMMAAIAYYFILVYQKKLSDKIQIKQLVKIALFIFIVFGLFVSLRSIIGRGMSEKSASDPLYYFTVYAGGPIPLLDDFLQNPPEKSEVFGKELFFRINRFFGNLLDKPELVYISHKEFRNAPTGYSLGNVYTAFRSYIYDFGYVGLIIFTSLTSAIYSIYYTLLKNKKANKHKVDTSLIIYGYIVPGIFLMSISERLFSIYFSVNSLKMIFFIYIANVILTRIKFEWFGIKFIED